MTEAQWLGSGNPVLAFESSQGWPSPRKQRLLAVACCRRVVWSRGESTLRDALSVAERLADRRAKRAELAAHFDAVHRLITFRDTRTYGSLFDDFARTAVYWACQPSKREYAGNAALRAACAAAYSTLPPGEPYVPPAESRFAAAWGEAERAEKRAQIELVLEVCGDPFAKEVAPVGRAGAVALRLAESAYEERLAASGQLDSDRLAVLSDALEEGGCDEERILGHLRSPGPHVRGCWALDLILGKK